MAEYDPEEVSERVAGLNERLAHLEDTFEEKLEDVRERVVQVKREVDDKAPDDHEHEAIIDRLVELESDEELEEVDEPTERLDDLEEKAETLAAAALDVQERLDDLTHLEDVVEGQLGASNDLEEQVEHLAETVQDVQHQLEEGGRPDAPEERLDRLFERANSEGVRQAKCADCDQSIDLALLRSPACPSCGVTFVDVEAGGLFRSGVLQVGASPAREPSEERDSLGRQEASEQSDSSRDGPVEDTADDTSPSDDQASPSDPIPIRDDDA